MSTTLPFRPPVAGLNGSIMRFNTNEEYHSDSSSLSSSGLKEMLVSPAHFLAARRAVHTSTKAFDFGSLLHTTILEPHKLHDEYAIFEGKFDARIKACKQFAEENVGKIIVDREQFVTASDIAAKVFRKVFRGRTLAAWLADCDKEPSIYWTNPLGQQLRVRPDAMCDAAIFDLKSTARTDIRKFRRTVEDFDYDLSAAMYRDGARVFDGRARPFVWIVCEKEDPYSVSIVEAGDTVIENGHRKYAQALTDLAALRASGLPESMWPDGAFDSVLELSHWAEFNPEDQPWRRQMLALSHQAAA